MSISFHLVTWGHEGSTAYPQAKQEQMIKQINIGRGKQLFFPEMTPNIASEERKNELTEDLQDSINTWAQAVG